MAAVDHEARLQPGLAQTALGLRGVARFVIAALAAAAQDDVAVRIARRGDNAGAAILVDAEETVRRTRRKQRIQRRLDASVGAVFEADRHGEAAGHFTVGLRFGRARADRGPTHHVRNVLRHDRVKKLRGRGQPQLRDLQQQTPRQLQTSGQIARIIHARIVDQSLPANGRARLLEIDAHENAHRVGQFLPQRGQSPGIIERPRGVVDRARTDNDQEPCIPSLQNRLRLGASRGGGGKRRPADRQRFFDQFGRDQALEAAHPRVFQRTGGAGAGGLLLGHGADGGGPDIKPQTAPRRNSRLAQRLSARSGGG